MESESNRLNEESRIVAQLTECQMSIMLYVRSLLPGDPGAHDVVQNANAKIWEKRSSFEPGTNFKAWALAIARYEVLSYRKKQARDSRTIFSEDLQHTIAAEIEEQDDDLASRQEALRQCLDSLKPRSRDLILQRYSTSEPLTVYAERLGRSVGSMKVTLHRLRTTLCQCVERRMRLSGESQ